MVMMMMMMDDDDEQREMFIYLGSAANHEGRVYLVRGLVVRLDFKRKQATEIARTAFKIHHTDGTHEETALPALFARAI